MCLLLLAGSAAAAHTVAGNKRAADRAAGALLGRVRLPPGAVQSAGEPAGGGSALANPAISIGTTALRDAHRWWRAPGSMSTVLAFVRRHPPQGGTLFSSGSGGRYGRTTSEWIAYSFRPAHDVLSVRQLVVEVAPLGGGAVGVRADAEIEWTVPRPAGERVPRTARLLTVTRSALSGWPPPLSMTIAERAKIRRIAAMLDRLEIVQPVAVACPALFPAPIVSLTFRARPGGPPLARATMAANGPDGECSPITFSVRGRREPALLAYPPFLRRAGSALGVGLAS